MGEFTFAYKPIAESTWAYLSSLLMLALFFKFNRFWSIRNFDLLLIIMLAPGILLIESGRQWQPPSTMQPNIAASVDPDATTAPADVKEAIERAEQAEAGIDPPRGPRVQDDQELPADEEGEPDEVANPTVDPSALPFTLGQRLRRWGYIWLFSIGTLFLIRMLVDPAFVRRPLLEPNLAIGGMVFLACSLMIFLFANIISAQPTGDDLRGARSAVKLLQREAAGAEDEQELLKRGPGYMLLYIFPIVPTFEDSSEMLETDADEAANLRRYVIAAKTLAIISQFLVVIGLVLIGSWHFQSFSTGVAMATIYLILPYTAVFTGHVQHALPAALLVWSIVLLRRPMWAGIVIGLAIGLSYYAIFLLPLWASFYWEKGVKRFVGGIAISLGICIAGLMFTSSDLGQFVDQLRMMFGFWLPLMDGLGGIWGLGWDHWFRVPLLAAFIALCVSFVFWPMQKDIGTLISYSCAVMVAVQFWHGFGGGLYMAWYLPMALATFFRPNTQGRVAMIELERRPAKKESIEDLLPV